MGISHKGLFSGGEESVDDRSAGDAGSSNDSDIDCLNGHVEIHFLGRISDFRQIRPTTDGG